LSVVEIMLCVLRFRFSQFSVVIWNIELKVEISIIPSHQCKKWG